MKYKCTVKEKKTNQSFESQWCATEADARREAWELSNKPKSDFSTISRSRYTVKVESREL
jgi:hypothetical protein